MGTAKWKNPSLTREQHLTIYSFGASCPEYWLRVALLQDERIRSLQVELSSCLNEAHTRGTPIPELYGDDARFSIRHLIGVEAHLMVYAADHAILICNRYKSLTENDPRICRALSRFDATGKGCDQLRDMFAHIEDYAVGTGRRAVGVHHDGPHLEFDSANSLSELSIQFGHISIALHQLAAALVTLIVEVRAALDARLSEAQIN